MRFPKTVSAFALAVLFIVAFGFQTVSASDFALKYVEVGVSEKKAHVCLVFAVSNPNSTLEIVLPEGAENVFAQQGGEPVEYYVDNGLLKVVPSGKEDITVWYTVKVAEYPTGSAVVAEADGFKAVLPAVLLPQTVKTVRYVEDPVRTLETYITGFAAGALASAVITAVIKSRKRAH